MTVQTMTQEEIQAFEHEHAKRCPCGSPISKYSKSGLCNPCSNKVSAANRTCERCGHGRLPGKKLCARCEYHENGPRSKYASKPTEAQRKAWTTSKQRTSTLKKGTPSWCAKSATHAHHWIVGSLPVQDGIYRQDCKWCGETKYVNPFGVEDEAREKVSQRMRTGASAVTT